jgi:hypothetical protein
MWPVLQSLEHKQAYNGTVLNQHRRGTTSGLKPDANQDSARSHVKIIIILILQDQP